MMNSKVKVAMNEQIKHEIGSSYLYLSMAAYFDSLGLDGMGNWMRCQAQEELVHAMKFFNHMNDRDARVELLALEKPQVEWSSPLDAFKAAYKHEQFISAKINDIMAIAHAEKDFAAIPLLNWFVNEQIEEESSTAKVAQQLELVGSSNGLFMLDRELAQRTFVYPAAGTATDVQA
jgi:ferritin